MQLIVLWSLTAVVGKEQAVSWKLLLRGLWLSGLRLGEALALSWDDATNILVDLSGKYPMLQIKAEAEKGCQDRTLPMAPEFAEALQAVSEEDQAGLVFRLKWRRNHGTDQRVDSVSQIISEIGKKAGVMVSKTKCASAYDLRRSFGFRWANRVRPHVLQQLMRHASIETTMRYYVQSEADEIGAAVWSAMADVRRDSTTTAE